MRRDDSVSIAKGIAIILMVMAHARCPLWIQYYINMFHMPLFFFMSGYCFKETYLDDPKSFVMKRVKGIYLPYIKWSLVFLLFHNIFFYLNIYNDLYGFNGKVSHLYDVQEFITKTLWIIFTMGSHEQLLGGYWFMKSLFFASIIFFFLLKWLHSSVMGFVLVIATLLGGIVGRGLPVIGIGSREFMAAFFIWSGYIYKKRNLHIDRKYLIVIYACIVALGTTFWQGTMLDCKWELIIPYMFTALCGTLMVFGISKYLNGRGVKFLLYVGNNTLQILTWHFLSFKIISLLIIAIYHLPIEHLAEFPVIEQYAYQGWWVVYMVIGIGVPIGVCYYIDSVKNKMLFSNQLN